MTATTAAAIQRRRRPVTSDQTALRSGALGAPRSGANRRRGDGPRAARADRVLTLRCSATEASLMHPVLVGADLVLEVIAGAVDRDGHGAVRHETRERPQDAVGARALNDSRLRLRRESRRERVREI